jgi:hypothetical protein
LGAFLFLVAAAAPAAALQDPNRLLQDERRQAMDARERPAEDAAPSLLWDAGGWLHAEVTTFEDPPEERERTYRYADLRLWGELRFDRHTTAYVRVLSDVLDFNSGDQFEGEDDDEIRPLYLDQAWLSGSWDFDGATLEARGGRAFFTLGRGLLFNQVAYGLEAAWNEPRWGVRAFAAHSILHDDDLDTSLPNADDSRRAFFALEGEALLTGNHRAYGIVLVERDFNEEDPEVAAQDWGYHATYLAAGARGTIWRNLGYSLEGTYQTGSSVAAGSTESETISAFAFLGAVDYTWTGDLAPYAVVEYMYGSGDPDRGSVTEVAAGNTAGTDDEGFLAFGFVQTGFALFPRVSNLHLVRVGGSIRPLGGVEAFRGLELGAYGYAYRKAESSAPISDPRASEDDEDVGTEIDVLLRWRIFSDLGVSLTWGRFFPGSAYPDDSDSARDFLSVGMTVSF